MLKKAAGKAMWLGGKVSAVLGLALALALVVGVGTAALAAVPGDPFRLGQLNTINAMTQLVGSVNNPMLKVDNDSSGANATALNLQVQPGKAPMKVNSATKVASLNADRLDGKSVEQVGVNGYQRVRVESAFDSTSSKSVNAPCPNGKVVVGGGAQVFPSLADPQGERAPIVIRYSTPDAFSESWTVVAEEISDYGFSWWVSSTAICATAP